MYVVSRTASSGYIQMTITEKLSAVDCTDWCECGDGHSTVSHPEAQFCASEGRSVILSRHHCCRSMTALGSATR